MVGVGGNAAVLFSTITHTEVLAINVGQGVVGLLFQFVKLCADILKLVSSD